MLTLRGISYHYPIARPHTNQLPTVPTFGQQAGGSYPAVVKLLTPDEALLYRSVYDAITHRATPNVLAYGDTTQDTITYLFHIWLQATLSREKMLEAENAYRQAHQQTGLDQTVALSVADQQKATGSNDQLTRTRALLAKVPDPDALLAILATGEPDTVEQALLGLYDALIMANPSLLGMLEGIRKISRSLLGED